MQFPWSCTEALACVDVSEVGAGTDHAVWFLASGFVVATLEAVCALGAYIEVNVGGDSETVSQDQEASQSIVGVEASNNI